jgi:hypothetical protein
MNEVMSEVNGDNCVKVECVASTELTLRQMCTIYPSAKRQLWPVPVESEPKHGQELRSALISSLFNSCLTVFDVNVLGIIREYAAYTSRVN